MKVKNEAQYPSKAFLYYVAQLGQEDYKKWYTIRQHNNSMSEPEKWGSEALIL